MIGVDIERGTDHRPHVERITPFSSARRELLESLHRRREQIIIGAIGAICIVTGLAINWSLGQWNEAQYRDKVAAFSQQVRGKLSGEKSLSPGDKYYPSVEVTPADITWFGRSSIEQVNVREFPSVYSGDPIGTVFVGTAINNVVVTNGEQRDSRWGAFLCTGITQWAKPPLAFDSLGNRVCTIDVDFLQKVGADGSINYGNGVIGPSSADQQRANQPTTFSK